MKKILLSVLVAVLHLSVYAVPSVGPTAGSITLVFKAPESMACQPVIQFVGDAGVPSWTPGADTNPAAEAIAGEEGWYKLVFPDTYVEGKIVPKNIDGTSGWKYQGKYTQVEGSEVDWLTISGDNEHQLVFSEGKSGGVAFLNVTQWNSDPCDAANPAGEASFTVTFEVPETVEKSDIAIKVEGNGDGASWATLGEIAYDEDFDTFSGAIEVPAGCSYKYLISYKGQSYIYMSGDNLSMPFSMVANDEVTEWDSDPFVEPEEGGTGTFTITFTGSCVPTADQKVFIAGNFDDTPSWERTYQMDKTGEATWTYTDLTYPSGFSFKFVIQYLDEQGEVSQEIWNPTDNITFDGVTFDYELEAGCPEVAADEAEADAAPASYKVVENGNIVIITPAGKFNLLGNIVK